MQKVQIYKTDEYMMNLEIRTEQLLIKNNTRENSLGVKVHNKLHFDTHMKGICKNVNNALRALAKATSYVYLEKKKLLVNSFLMQKLNTVL